MIKKGDILLCIDDNGARGVTQGIRYEAADDEIRYSNGAVTAWITADNHGNHNSFYASRFKVVSASVAVTPTPAFVPTIKKGAILRCILPCSLSRAIDYVAMDDSYMIQTTEFVDLVDANGNHLLNYPIYCFVVLPKLQPAAPPPPSPANTVPITYPNPTNIGGTLRSLLQGYSSAPDIEEGLNCTIALADSRTAPVACDHQWSRYEGITQVFDFCTICDTKRNT